jgi:hypothetical protein
LFHFLDQFEGFGEGDHKYAPLKLVRRAALNKLKTVKGTKELSKNWFSFSEEKNSDFFTVRVCTCVQFGKDL